MEELNSLEHRDTCHLPQTDEIEIEKNLLTNLLTN